MKWLDVNPRGEPGLPEVLINGRFLGQRVTGVQRYGRETLHCLDELLASSGGAGARWTVLVPRGTQVPAFRHLVVETVGRLQGHLWEQLELLWRARSRLLISFGFTGPMLKRWQIITVHDAAVVRMPQAFTPGFRSWYRWLVSTIAARAPRTMAVSQFSAREAAECFGAPMDRLRVTTEGWQHLERSTADESVLDRHGLRAAPFALAVSSPTPSKNFAAIASAVALLGPDAPRCVVVGAADGAVFRAAGDASDALCRVGYVSDAELKALYQHATCFVFPSLYEGFGIPPLEAMACGCPVIASTAPAIREVCGDAALYFDPASPLELADRLRAMFDEPALRADMRRAGLDRVRSYSWERAASLSLSAIREVIAR
ncbi:glycosyltransferase family 4 protein [Piscinibacter sp.]|jgi:glycosyltransferase involved in cell wall biosynthesis|uniref:glycosyltransferase family 4 protein n=1 Tax=Piscinibacter sp. TaxID=1903157 RepID=UPI002F416674